MRVTRNQLRNLVASELRSVTLREGWADEADQDRARDAAFDYTSARAACDELQKATAALASLLEDVSYVIETSDLEGHRREYFTSLRQVNAQVKKCNAASQRLESAYRTSY